MLLVIPDLGILHATSHAGGVDCMLGCNVQSNAQKYICMTYRLCCSWLCTALKMLWHPMQQQEILEKSPCPTSSFQSSEGTLCVPERKLLQAATLIKRSRVQIQGANVSPHIPACDLELTLKLSKTVFFGRYYRPSLDCWCVKIKCWQSCQL